MPPPSLPPFPARTLEVVVDDEDLDANAVLHCSDELHARHEERRVAVNVDDSLTRCAELGANGCGDPKAHGSRTTARDDRAWHLPPVVLRGPHLVLPDTRRDDRVGHRPRALQLVVHLLHNALRLECALSARRRVRKRVRRLPRPHLRPPLGALCVADAGQQRREVRAHVAEDHLMHLHNLVGVLVRELKVDDAPAPLSACGIRSGGKLLQVSRHAVIKARAKSDNHVSALKKRGGLGEWVARAGWEESRQGPAAYPTPPAPALHN